MPAMWPGAAWSRRTRSRPSLRALMLHRMVFGFPDGELMLSIPMPAPRGEDNAPAISSGSGRSTESALAGLCTDESGRRHGVSIPPPLIRPELIAALKQDAARVLAPQLAALVNATAQIILQPIFDLESPRIAFGRVALVGDAAFVARPHVATGVMKAADRRRKPRRCAGRSGDDVAAALARYNARAPALRRRAGRARPPHRRLFRGRGGDRRQRIETLMREYGAAGLVHDQVIRARFPYSPHPAV